MSQFSEIKKLLENITTQCGHADKLRGKYHQPLFDSSLFKCRAKSLLPCALEATKTYNAIIREQSLRSLTPSRAQHLTERLTNQISALQRELVTQDLREDKPAYRLENKSLNELYNDLSQHQDWNHRLTQLVQIKLNALAHAPTGLKPQAEHALDAAEQRLSRCQDAMQKIEKQIALDNPNYRCE